MFSVTIRYRVRKQSYFLSYRVVYISSQYLDPSSLWRLNIQRARSSFCLCRIARISFQYIELFTHIIRTLLFVISKVKQENRE